MEARLQTTVLLLALVIAAAAAAVVLGTWTLGMSAVIMLLLVVYLLSGWQGSLRWGRVSILFGLIGGLVAMASAAAALLASGVADSGRRVGFGWAALALAVIAALSASEVQAQPRLAAVGLVSGSSLGFLAISLFDIYTFYAAALPLCWIAAGLAVVSTHPTGSRGRAND